MRPSFKCSAAKQRKKPYSLDPFDSTKVIPVPINRFLRRYQRIGVQFFYERYKGIKVEGIGKVKGGILGDDMGLGKTIQVLAFVSFAFSVTAETLTLRSYRLSGNRLGPWPTRPTMSRGKRARAFERAISPRRLLAQPV